MWTAIFIDFFLTLLVWGLAVVLRAQLGIENAPALAPYMKFGVLMGALTVIVFARSGLYERLGFRSRTKELIRIWRANSVAFLSFILFAYFFSEIRISRATLLIYLPLSYLLFTLERMAVLTYLRYSPQRERGKRDVVLVGNGEQLKDYIEIVRHNPYSGVRIVGWWDAPVSAAALDVPLLKTDFEKMRESVSPQGFVVSYDGENAEKVEAFLRMATNDVTGIFVLPNLRGYALLGLTLEDFSGLPILALNQPNFSALDTGIKRAVDFIASFLGLALLSPFLLILGALVKLSSPGPIFFTQERMGIDGTTFKMLKFRTMKVGPAQPGWTIANDPRRTKIGTFLRRTSIDELPQLWNVLVGDMSLVGPRPEQPYFVQNFRKEIPAYMLRHKMKAGITGWAQVNGWRGDTSLHSRIECDLYYIRNWSLLLDFKILFLTFWKGFINKNAY